VIGGGAGRGRAAGPTEAPDAIVALLAGGLAKEGAERRGMSVLGDIEPLARLRAPDWLSGPEVCEVPGKAAPRLSGVVKKQAEGEALTRADD
jgi:hypothetical protein